jgi:hypothetical protein
VRIVKRVGGKSQVDKVMRVCGHETENGSYVVDE